MLLLLLMICCSYSNINRNCPQCACYQVHDYSLASVRNVAQLTNGLLINFKKR